MSDALHREPEQFLIRSFRRLDQRGIQYVVLRNAEELSNLESDVDVVVRKRDSKKFEQVLDQTCKELEGYLVRRDIFLGIRQSVYFFPNSGAEPVFVGMDLKEDLIHQGLVSIQAEDILQGRRRWRETWRPSYCNESTALLLHAVLDKGWFREGYMEEILKLRNKDREGFASCLRSVLLAGDAEWVEHCLDQGAFEDLLQRDRWVNSLISKRPAQKWLLWRWRFLHLLRNFKFAFMRRGALVAILGPDGVGKSTLLNHLTFTLEKLTLKVVGLYFGVRTPLLPTKRIMRSFHAKRSASKQGTLRSVNPPETRTEWTYFLGAIHHLTDQLLRYWVYARIPLARQRIVICDRYFYDFVATRFPRLRQLFMEAVLRYLVPRPDLTIVLSGDPEDIYQRKDELSILGIRKQLKHYTKLREAPFFAYVVDVDRTPEEMTLLLLPEVLAAFSERNA